MDKDKRQKAQDKSKKIDANEQDYIDRWASFRPISHILLSA